MSQTKECYTVAQRRMKADRIIKAMRFYLGLSQATVAERLGVATTAYVRYEQEWEYIFNANYSEACKLLEILQLDPQTFFKGEYELSELGYILTNRRHALNKKLRNELQKCCPVSVRTCGTSCK